MIAMKTMFFFSLILLLLILNITYMPVPIAGSGSSVLGRSEDQYTVILNKNATVELYLLSRNGSAVMVPLDRILKHSCFSGSVNSSIGVRFLSVIVSGSVNLTLPNGNHINTLNIDFYVYPGCSVGKPRIYNITVRQDFPKTLDMIVKVLLPPPANGYTYSLPAFLFPAETQVIYRYINETHFAVIINLENVRFDDITFNSKRFNITVKYLVNRETWNAKYWDGHRWVNAGVLPIGAPDLDVTSLLYKLYKGYTSAADYYLTHRGQLAETVSKLKTLLANNETVKAQKLLENITRAPIPAEWRGHHLVYLGFNYSLNPIEGSAESRILNFTVPEYNWAWIYPSRAILTERNAIIKAAVDYITGRNVTGFENMIISNNGFTVYKPIHHRSGNGSVGLILKEGVIPATSFYVSMPLPVDGMIGLPGDIAKDASLAILDVSSMFNNITKYLEVIHNVSLDSDRVEVRGGLSAAVDDRLVSEWMMSLNSIVPGRRWGVLDNLLNTVTNSYRETWYEIVNGGNATSALEEFKDNVRTAVLAAALQLGGKPGKEMIESMISPKAGAGTQASSSPGNTNVSTVTSGNSEINETPSRPVNSSSAAGGVAGHGNTLLIAAVLILVIAGLAAGFVYAKRPTA